MREGGRERETEFVVPIIYALFLLCPAPDRTSSRVDRGDGWRVLLGERASKAGTWAFPPPTPDRLLLLGQGKVTRVFSVGI